MRIRPLLLGFALLGTPALLAGPLATEAHAQTPFPASGLIEILPPAGVVGDGQTSVKVHVVALNADGTPMSGLKLKASASAGTAEGWNDVGNGIYAFDFVPPSADQSQTITLTAKGKTPSKETISVTLDIPVQARLASEVTVTSNPAQMVLGQNKDSTLSLSAKDGVVTDLETRTNTGSVVALTGMGGGKWTARFEAPKVNYPHLAIVTVADPARVEDAAGYTVIPLNGAVDYPVQASPNATVVLRIGDREFGPVQADATGKANVPVVVSPGVRQATQVTIVNGTPTEQVIDLRVPETKRMSLMPVRDVLPGDNRIKMTVRTVVLQADGTPDTSAQVAFTANAGTFGATTHEGKGVYSAVYTPPSVAMDTPVTIQAQVGGSTVQIDTEELTLVPPRPTFLSLSSEPEQLAPDATSFKVFAKALDENGKGLPKRSLRIFAKGAELGDVVDLGGGDYRADFTVDPGDRADLFATVLAPPSGGPLRHIVLVPARKQVAPDGGLPVLVVTVDANGQPVANAPVNLSATGGSLPDSVTTNENGIALAVFKSGSQAGVARLAAASGSLGGASAVVVGPDSVAVELPPSGSATERMLAASWSDISPSLQVTREGDAVAAAPAPAPAPEPEPARETSTEPIAALSLAGGAEAVPAGGTLEVTITALDAAGLGVPGQSLDVMTSAGTLGEVNDGGTGDYAVQLSVPADAEGEVKVSVASENGIMGLLKVPVGPAAVAAAPEPVTPPDDPATVAKPGKENDAPWLRARISGVGSTYQYNQKPSIDPGPLLPEALSVGAAYGGSNATPVGAELAARGWVPMLPYVGFNVVARGTNYGIAADAFNDVARDWLYDIQVDAAGRYFFDINGDRFWIGGKVGFRYTDFMIFTGCLEPDCSVEYGPLGLPGLGLGAEIGAEIGDFYLVAGPSEGFAGVTPYATSVDANVGYQIIDNAFVDVGFTGLWRNLVLEGQDSGVERGTLTDNQLLFKVGAGFSM